MYDIVIAINFAIWMIVGTVGNSPTIAAAALIAAGLFGVASALLSVASALAKKHEQGTTARSNSDETP